MWTPRSPECLLLLVGLLPLAVAAAVDGDPAAHDRISRDRAVVQREAQLAQAACAQAFAVTACVDRVKAERRTRLKQLDLERAALDEQARRRRAAERLELVRQRQAASEGEPPALTVRARAPVASQPAATPAPASRSAAASAQAHQAAASQAAVEASRRVAAAAQRASQAQQHRAAIEERNQSRAKQHPPAAPLPVPPALPASR